MINYVPYSSLSHKKYVSYSELLMTTEWAEKRKTIITQYNNRCSICGNVSTVYIDGRNIWYGDLIPTKTTLLSTGQTNITLLPEIIDAKKQYTLHVHHKYYISNKLPWEYNDDALICICNWCHKHIHETETIKVFDIYGKEITNCEKCDRCGGSGILPEYNYYEGGICFKCNGLGYILPTIKIR